ncbi:MULTISPECIES: hypothetical protein [unclassified Coleofasciculus]|nr:MULTISPECIES: hypothetical protein [unclassified Coleofasciculus]MBD1840658.1 hypothetical protein [Coleofasciculus sp. FACHB-501]
MVVETAFVIDCNDTVSATFNPPLVGMVVETRSRTVDGNNEFLSTHP